MGVQCSCIQQNGTTTTQKDVGGDSGRIHTLQIDIANRSILEDSIPSEQSEEVFAESHGLFSPTNALPKARAYFPRLRSFDSDIQSDYGSDDSWKKTVSFSQFISNESKVQTSRKEFMNPKYGNAWGSHNVMLKQLIDKTDNQYLWEGENSELKTRCLVRYTLFDSSQLFPDDLMKIEALLHQVSSLESPNIAEIYSFGIYEQMVAKKPYAIVVVNQEIGSCTVKDMFDAKASSGEKWKEHEILHIIHGVLDGLIMCNHFNITNHKLKMDNIMFSEVTGEAMLMEFDLQAPAITSPSSSKSVSTIYRKSLFGKGKGGIDSSRELGPPSLGDADKQNMLSLLFKLIGPDNIETTVETIQATDKCMQDYNHIFGLLQIVSAKEPFGVINKYLADHIGTFDRQNTFKIEKSPPLKMNQSQTLEMLAWKFKNYFWVGNFNFAQGVFLQLAHVFSSPKAKFLSREYQQYMKLGNRLLKHLVETKDFIKARDIAHELNTQVQTNKDFKKVLKNLPSEYITFKFLIGNVYDGLKETDKAIKFYSKGLEHCTHKKIKTENFKIVLKRIATLLLEKNQEKEALDYFKKLIRQKSEKNDLEEIDVYTTMGEILKNQGNLKQSIKYYLQAWESTKNEKLREDIILKRIDICSKLAETYIAIDEEQNALRFETESSNLKKRVFGKESQEYKKSLKKLAEMHMKLKNYEACCECYLTYHKLLKKEGVSTSKELEDSISYLADAYFICGNYKEALTLYKQHAEVIEKTYGPRNKRYLKIQDNIAKTLFKSEIYKTSLDVQLASIAIKKQVYHKNDIEIVIALNNIGLTYYALNRYEDALASHFKSLEALEVQSPVNGNRGKEYILLSIALDYRKLENSSKGLEYIYESFKSGDQAAQEEPTNPENALEFYDNVGEHVISGLNFDKVARET